MSERVLSCVPEDCGEGGAGHELGEVAELLSVELVLWRPARPPHRHRLQEGENERRVIVSDSSIVIRQSLATFFEEMIQRYVFIKSDAMFCYGCR